MSFIGATLRLNVFDGGFVNDVGSPLTAIGLDGGAPEFAGGALATLDATVDLLPEGFVIEFLSAASFEPRLRSDEALGLTLTDVGDSLPLITNIRVDSDATDFDSVQLDRRRDAVFVNVGRDGGWEAGDRIVLTLEFGVAGTDRAETLLGAEGADTIHADGGNDLIRGFAGEDVLLGQQGNDRIFGGDDDDFASGGAGNDRVAGDGGDDEVDGRSGNDRLWGGEGEDRLDGDVGADRLWGGLGEDSLFGGGGRDVLRGGEERDRLSGGNGDDRLFGEGGDDSLAGDAGDDVLYGGDGRDTMTGRFGRDEIFGGAGDDFISSEDGEMALHGEAGADVFRLRAGVVDARGGGGADRFEIDLESDVSAVVRGGGGADVFELEADRGRGDIEAGPIRIVDFDGARGDRLDLDQVDGDISNFTLDPLTFIGSAAFSGAGAELRYQARRGVLSADVDADGVADFTVSFGRGTVILEEHLFL